MSYTPAIKVYLADGTTLDTSKYASGLVNNCLHAEYNLGARTGCRGGRLVLPGTVQQPLMIPVGAVVKFYYDSTTLVYTGIVAQAKRSIEESRHTYELDSYWRELAKVDMSTRQLLGSANGATNTAKKAIKWLLDERIVPAGIGVSYDAGDLVENNTALADLVMEPGADLYRVIETLEWMASATDGKVWVAGIDAARKFYFKPIDSATVIGRFQIGATAIRGEEQDAKRAAKNRLVIRGGMVPTRGLLAKRIFQSASSIAAYGASSEVRIWLPHLRTNADFTTFAAGFWARRSAPRVLVENLQRIHGTSDGVVEPWAGYATYEDQARGGELRRDWAGDAHVTFDARYDVTITLGGERPEAQSSAIAPEDTAGADEDPLGPDGIDPFDDTYPEVDDTVAPPADYPTGVGPDTTTVPDPGLDPGPAVGISARTVMAIHAPGGWEVDRAELKWIIVINNGGTATAEGLLPVSVQAWFRNAAGTVTNLGNLACVKLHSIGNTETWITQTGITPAAGGTYAARARVLQVKANEADPDVYQYYPEDGDSPDWHTLITTTVIDPGEGAGGGTDIMSNSGWFSPWG